MQIAVEEAAASTEFGVADIVRIHGRLMDKSPTPRLAGKVRDRQNWIGGNDYNPCGADFVPPPPDEIDDLLADLCEAINDDRHPPMLQAALVHAQFETIHPFDDGNGRTGRALIHVVLRRRGITPSYVPPISVVLAGARDRYIGGLTSFRDGDLPGWAQYFAAAGSRAAHLASSYLAEVQALSETWRQRLRNAAAPRGDAAAWAIIDILPAHPLITAPVAAAATSRAKAAVYQGLTQLEEAGVLMPLSKSKRNQSWEAVGLLELLTGLVAGRLP
jgi:Fic family protein